jgi:hypothetical protein
METITINGKTADITLESEKTLKDLLKGLDPWLEGMGQSLSGIEIDGKSYGYSSLEKSFDLELESISRIDIKTSSWTDLMLEALLGVKNDLEYFIGEKNALNGFSERSEWEASYTADFLRQNASDMYSLVLQILDGKLTPESSLPLIQERIREIKNPHEEIKVSVPPIREIAKRLEDLPLDLQTGKEARAAETITLFSGITEKLFRLLFFIKQYGGNTDSLKNVLTEFGSVVKEIYSAYESRDTVLVGDLAEYELAPRLLELVSRLDELALPQEVSG